MKRLEVAVTSHERGRRLSTTPQGVMMRAELDDQGVHRGSWKLNLN